MTRVNPGLAVVDMPILTPAWSLEMLNAVLTEAMRNCVGYCQASLGDCIHFSLSGGLDSTLSLAMIRAMTPVSIRTYTVGASEHHPDVVMARLASRRFGTIHSEWFPSAQQIEERKPLVQALTGETSLGAVAVYCLYEMLDRHDASTVIAHDGIDELMGGYWDHRKDAGDLKAKAFRDRWSRLAEDHLIPLAAKANHFSVTPVHPYLQCAVVEYITRIPLDERTDREVSKKPLRELARRYGVPQEIIARQKLGFCDALTDLT